MYSILVIDSDKEYSNSLKMFLRKEGYKVYSSETAKSGFQKSKDKKPDLVLMESIFPGADGLELLKDIKFDITLANTRLIVLSYNDNDFDTALALELGADDYISKEASFREIAAKIKSQFRYPGIHKNHYKKIPEQNNN